jgi:hypothetical protein
LMLFGWNLKESKMVPSFLTLIACGLNNSEI